MKTEIYFSVNTPLGVDVRTTVQYWEYLVTIKHPVMKNKEDIVRSVLQMPDEIRQSKVDKDIFLYYKQYDRLYCVVARHAEIEGFLITAYPTDKVKEGEGIILKKDKNGKTIGIEKLYVSKTVGIGKPLPIELVVA